MNQTGKLDGRREKVQIKQISKHMQVTRSIGTSQSPFHLGGTSLLKLSHLLPEEVLPVWLSFKKI